MSKSSMPPGSMGSSSPSESKLASRPDVVVQRAARALREQVTGEHRGAGFTRARVINGLHRKRRRRWVHWILFSPALALLVGGSAWAQATQSWPTIWLTVQTVAARSVQLLAGSAEDAEPPPAPKTLRQASSASSAQSEPSVSPPSPPAPPESAALPAPAEPETALVAEHSMPRAKRSPTAASKAAPKTKRKTTEEISPVHDDRTSGPPFSGDSAPQNTLPITEAGPDPENVAFRRAYDLQERANHAAALQAHEDYLRQFPRGRFAPEARYNRAVLLIRLGRYSEARRALEPFVEGAYGNYRRTSARRLLEALADKD